MSYTLNTQHIHFNFIFRNRIAVNTVTIRAYKIALRCVYFTSSPEHNLFLCRSVLVLLVFFPFSGGILYHIKETAQHLSTECRFCSNNASESRGNDYVNCNIPFPIHVHHIEIPNSPHTIGNLLSMLCYVYSFGICRLCLYSALVSSIHSVDNLIMHAHT